MDVFDRFTAPDASQTIWGYYPLKACKTIKGFTGTFYRLTCSDDTGQEIIATCDEKHREHLRPYLELLVMSEDGTSHTESPATPLFQGRDGGWRFSWLGAEHDHPELELAERARTPTTPSPSTHSAPEDGATRLQVSVSRDLAHRFKGAAAARGTSHTDLLLQLIRSTVTESG